MIFCFFYLKKVFLICTKFQKTNNMAKNLVIVESPAKKKIIQGFLGKDFVVESSIGHIRDLPKKGGMAIDIENGFKPNYVISEDKTNVVKHLRSVAKKAETVWLATDEDREGEAIAWHLQEAIGGDSSRYHRVVFNEITQKAIQEAFKEPGQLDIDRVYAQQARRFLDRVVGFEVSPLLWAKVARGLSAGRVQSVATRLIVEREREIRVFVPDEYWEVHALLKVEIMHL